jgi:hypothetical protein
MAERDKVIKSGQLTLPRLLFLVVVGGVIVFTVYAGGIFLSIGYWLVTLAICGLLYLIAVDYGIKMDKIDVAGQPVQAAATPDAGTVTAPIAKAAGEARPKKRTARPAKRRR